MNLRKPRKTDASHNSQAVAKLIAKAGAPFSSVNTELLKADSSPLNDFGIRIQYDSFRLMAAVFATVGRSCSQEVILTVRWRVKRQSDRFTNFGRYSYQLSPIPKESRQNSTLSISPNCAGTWLSGIGNSSVWPRSWSLRQNLDNFSSSVLLPTVSYAIMRTLQERIDSKHAANSLLVAVLQLLTYVASVPAPFRSPVFTCTISLPEGSLDTFPIRNYTRVLNNENTTSKLN